MTALQVPDIHALQNLQFFYSVPPKAVFKGTVHLKSHHLLTRNMYTFCCSVLHTETYSENVCNQNSSGAPLSFIAVFFFFLTIVNGAPKLCGYKTYIFG